MVDKFLDLHSRVTKEGGSTKDVRNKISEANGASINYKNLELK
jgi:hypothetical protein